MTITTEEVLLLRRSIALAAEALDAGDAPFGSVLAVEGEETQHEDRNRTVTTGDATRHPEFELARWAAANLTPEQRARATVYTSGEHCPMCSAAHAWVGLARIVYVASAAQLEAWKAEWGVPTAAAAKTTEGGGGVVTPTVAALPAGTVAPGVVVEGPVEELVPAIRELHRRHAGV
ncbi:cytidine and deoxycytidylate deaminase zinc-binding region [Apiospora marii]|uniref:cytidine and deoxycytidylate deaminase zinc-binding region n=1 Tax=Apiospora marii TaxID=335849 RepID=UPI003130A943